MDSLYILLASVLVAVLLTFRLFVGSRHEARHERRASARLETEPHGLPQARAAMKTSRYEAVSVQVCNSPCEAAKRIRKKTFLVSEAPSLPLPTCDRACHCEYQYHEDRRRHAERRYPSESLQLGTGVSQDARSGKDRRRRVEPYQGIY